MGDRSIVKCLEVIGGAGDTDKRSRECPGGGCVRREAAIVSCVESSSWALTGRDSLPTFSPSSGTPRKMSPSLEQYIEAISDLLTRHKVCSVSDIAEQVQVSRPAASRAVRELSEQDLVDHRSYGYVDLTQKGRAIANKLAGRHESLFAFLKDVLHFDEEWADQEACRLEHQVNDAMVERLAELSRFFKSNEDAAAQWEQKMRRTFKK